MIGRRDGALADRRNISLSLETLDKIIEGLRGSRNMHVTELEQ